MGYSTDFDGVLTFKEPLTSDALGYLNTFLDERSDEIDAYVDLEITKDFKGIKWNGAEKTYYMVEAINFITEKMREKYPEFELEGQFNAQGEDFSDRWVLDMVGGKAVKKEVVLKGKIITCPNCEEEFELEEAEEEE